MNDEDTLLRIIREHGSATLLELTTLTGWTVPDDERVGEAMRKLRERGDVEVKSDWTVVAK